jgi:hypothetical protein
MLVIGALCRKRFVHKSRKGVENRKCQREKCIRQFALSVERTVKFPSSLTQADPFTAENAGQRKEDQGEDINPS